LEREFWESLRAQEREGELEQESYRESERELVRVRVWGRSRESEFFEREFELVERVRVWGSLFDRKKVREHVMSPIS
jgi:hypothetical protein